MRGDITRGHRYVESSVRPRGARSAGRGRRRAVLSVTAVVVLAVLNGCGSRLSSERFLADARASVSFEDRPAPDPGQPLDVAPPEYGAGDETGAGDSIPEPGAGGKAADGRSHPTGGERPAGIGAGGPGGSGGAPTPVEEAGTNPAVDDGNAAPNDPAAATDPALDKPGVTQETCGQLKSPVVIGAVGANSGPLGTILLPGVNAVRAWAAYVNDTEGGLNCHPVKYIVADDGGDPSRHKSLVRRMVEQDGVVAFVQMTAILTGRSTMGYLTERQIPVIGGAGSEEWYYESPVFFPQFSMGPSLYRASAAGIAEFAEGVGKRKVGVVYCVEVSQCTQYADAIEKHGPSYGIEVVYKGAASLAQPDYTANCQAAQAAGAEILYVGLDQGGIDRLAKSCASVNFRPHYGTTALVTDAARLAANPLLNGVFLTVDSLPWFMTSNPGITEFERVLKKYGPGVTIGPSAHGGWVSAKLFQVATQALPDPSTNESILRGLWSVKGNDLDGQTHPLEFTEGQPATPMACYWLARFLDDEWTSPNGGKRTCL